MVSFEPVVIISLIVCLVLPSIISTPPKGADAIIQDTYPYRYFSGGKMSTLTEWGGPEINANVALNVSEMYWIHTEFVKQGTEPDGFFYIVNIVDEDGYTVDAGAHLYGSSAPHDGYSAPWYPIAAGKYTIKTFLVYSLDFPHDYPRIDYPVILSTPTTYHVDVKEKIVALGVGQKNSGLQVESINFTDKTVKVIYDICPPLDRPTYGAAEQVLSMGDHVPLLYANATLWDVREHDAIFNYLANGRIACLI